MPNFRLFNSLAKKLSVAAAALSLLGIARAQVVLEVGDAGDLPATAQEITGSTSILSIQNTLTPGDRDLFLFRSPGGVFTASTPAAGADTQLFLFDATGRGIAANDDASPLNVGGGSFLSVLLQPGNYYLGIAQFLSSPISAGGEIFPLLNIFGIEGPTGPGGGLPIIGWEGAGGAGSIVGLTVTLTNATGTGTDIPNPGVPDNSSSVLLMALGIMSLVPFARWMRR